MKMTQHDRFQSLAKRLVAVPKAEVDKQKPTVVRRPRKKKAAA